MKNRIILLNKNCSKKIQNQHVLNELNDFFGNTYNVATLSLYLTQESPC